MKIRVLISSLLALCLAGGAARAAVDAEAIPADVIQQLAPFIQEMLQKQFPTPPVKVEPVAEKATGYHVMESVAVLMMPDKNLTNDAVLKAGEKEVPVSVVIMRSLGLTTKDGAVPQDKLAAVDFNGMFKLPVFYLAVQAKGEDRTLNVYSKDGKAIVSVLMKKDAAAGEGPVSIKMANIDVEKKKGDLIVSVAGAYQATVGLTVVAE